MPSYQPTPRIPLIEALTNDRPKAMAWVADDKNNPKTSGLVKFYQPANGGVLVEAEFFGLPYSSMADNSDFYAMHIHNFPDCGNDFANVGTHYNPENHLILSMPEICLHFYPIRDMPGRLSLTVDLPLMKLLVNPS